MRKEYMIAVIVRWLVPPKKYAEFYTLPDEIRPARHDDEFAKFQAQYQKLIGPGADGVKKEITFRTVDFETWFLDFLHRRKYCIWNHQTDPQATIDASRSISIRKETQALVDILSLFKAENIGLSAVDARIVFVHVGAMRCIRKMPHLVERRCNRHDVRFVTYGNHECVGPAAWGFHEIFPLGLSLILCSFFSLFGMQAAH